MAEHELRPMLNTDLEMVLKWRNDPEVRRFMYTSREIGLEEHRSWFNNTDSETVDLLIYQRHGTPQGFMNITRQRSPRVADWGFYLAPGAPKGSGRAMGQAALEYAFIQIGLHKLCGQALGFNERSIAFHLMLGFVEEGRLREHHFDGHKFHDVVCFGLLAKEWKVQDRSK